MTADEQITLAPTNFDLREEDYSYSYELTPTDKYDKDLVYPAAALGNVLLIEKRALQFDTDYKLVVKVYNQNIVSDPSAGDAQPIPGEKIVTFSTNAALPEGTILVETESDGVAIDEIFKVSMLDYSPPNRYMIYGVLVEDPDSIIRLTPLA